MGNKVLAWIGLILGFLLMAGVININSIFRIVGFIILIAALIFIIKDSK